MLSVTLANDSMSGVDSVRGGQRASASVCGRLGFPRETFAMGTAALVMDLGGARVHRGRAANRVDLRFKMMPQEKKIRHVVTVSAWVTIDARMLRARRNANP